MAIDPSISLAVRPPVIAPLQIQTPLERFAKVQTLRNLMGQGQLRELQMLQAQQELEQNRQAAQNEANFRALYADPNATPTRSQVYSTLGPKGAAVVKTQTEIAADDEKRQENYLRLIGQAGLASKNQQDRDFRIKLLVKGRVIPPDLGDQMLAQPFNLEETQAFGQQFMSLAEQLKEKREAADQAFKEKKQPFELRTAEAGATAAEQKAAGTEPITPYQQQQLDLSKVGKTLEYPAPVQAQKLQEAAALAGARTNVLQTPEKIAQEIAIAGETAKAVAQAKGPEKGTPAEKKSLSFWERGKSAADSIAPLEAGIANKNLGQQAWLQFMPNATQTEKDQKYRQAQRQFTESHLRPESGAAISPSEYENDARTYFAQPGDTPSTLAQKRAARAVILEGLRSEAGSAYEQKYGKQPQTGGADQKRATHRFNPQTGQIEVIR